MIYQKLRIILDCQRAVSALNVRFHRFWALGKMIPAFLRLVSIKFLTATLTIKYLMISRDMLGELMLILEPQFAVFARVEQIIGSLSLNLMHSC